MTENVFGIALGVAIFGLAYWALTPKRPATVAESPAMEPIGFVHFERNPA